MTGLDHRMPVRPLGRTGIDVTVLGFGASGIGNLGHATADGDAAAAVGAD